DRGRRPPPQRGTDRLQGKLRGASDHLRFLRAGPGWRRSRAMSLERCRLISLPRISDRRGNLTYVEGGRHIPFEIRRVYYLYDVPGGADRGGHCHKELEQVLIAMSGSFDVTLDDGSERTRYHLNRSYFGLYIAPMVWRELDNFSSGSVCLALASAPYVEAD